MKIVGIVGSNAFFSHNRLLLNFISRHFKNLFELEVLEIADVPLFNQSHDQTDHSAIQELVTKITAADGVIIATPEHNHTITAALKNTIEWLSFKVHPFEGKPVMIVGASFYQQGSSRAQLHLRQILDAPGVNAMVLPGNEFLLGRAKGAFDESGDIIDARTIDFLQSCLENFLQFIYLVKGLTNLPSGETQATDANSGASESWNTPASPKSQVPSNLVQTPFEVALDKTFGPDIGIQGPDIFDSIELMDA